MLHVAVSCEGIYRQIMDLGVAAKCRKLQQIAWFLSSKLRVAGSNPAGVANKINKLYDFRDRISTQRTAKGAAGVEIRPIHSLFRACACLSGAQPINRGLVGGTAPRHVPRFEIFCNIGARPSPARCPLYARTNKITDQP